jgi:hypothetical protein
MAAAFDFDNNQHCDGRPQYPVLIQPPQEVAAQPHRFDQNQERQQHFGH